MVDLLLSINWAQVLTFITVLFVVYYEIRFLRLTKEPMRDQPLILVWAIHSIIFYLAIFVDTINLIDLHKIYPAIFTTWSSLLRFHSTFTFLMIVRSNYQFAKLRQGTQKILKKYGKE